MYSLLTALLLRIDPERSHDLAMLGLRAFGALPGALQPVAGTGVLGTPVRLMGLDFPNRLGLAAGFDKDGTAIEGFARLGFGFLEIGTVTPRPQPGNPRPRLFRIREHGAVINRMGFNNEGVAVMAQRLRTLRRRDRLRGTLIGVNVGKNKDTPLESAHIDYTLCMDAVYPYADYLTLNLSSPNTPGLRQLQSGAELEKLLGAVTESRARLQQQHGVRVPLLLKIAPDLTEPDLAAVASAVGRFELDGLIATNTTISRPGLTHLAVAQETGGLSGTPLTPLALGAVQAVRQRLDPRVVVVGVGGIDSPRAAGDFLAAGADLLQIYTGFVFQGPGLVRRLVASGHAEGS